MKESPRSKLLRYLDGSDDHPDAVESLTNIYFIGLWETYFFYFPPAYITAKNTIEGPSNYGSADNHCWGKYFGKDVY